MHNVINKAFPFLNWFPLKGEDLKSDLLAGITVSLLLIPQSMAYAALAGLPPYYGLYTAFLPVMFAALWGSSNHLATGPVAVVSVMTATALSTHAQPGSEQYIALAIMMALLVGVIQLGLGLLKMGVVVNFLSHPVILGFTNAAAIIIVFLQLNKLLGVSRPSSDNFVQDIWGVLQQIPDTHLPTLMMAVIAILIMLFSKRFLPRVPGVLLAVVVTTVLSWVTGYEAAGGKVVGDIPPGLPTISLPQLDLPLLSDMIVSALFISLVGFVESISIARAIAVKSKHRVDPNQELIGQGVANLVGSVSQSFPVSGSFSRSALNFNTGGRTGMTSVFTALMVLITLLFLTPLMHHLPSAVLGAVIMVAVISLVNLKSILHVWKVHRHDGFASILTFAATLFFAPRLEWGIALGAGVALGLYLYRTMKPRIAILARHPDGTMRDAIRFDLPQDKRIVVIRFDGSLYFANISYFEDAIIDAEASHPDARVFLIVADGVNSVDASTEEVLAMMLERLHSNGIDVIFSGLKQQVLEIMANAGIYEKIGENNLWPTEDMALEYIYEDLLKVPMEDALLHPANAKKQ
jgi:SulP family sulfate permease